jgi:hypothetical protein
MMTASNYAELKILDHMLGTTAWTMPTQLYIKLHLGDPGEDCTNNAAAETTRKAIDWSSASSGTAQISSTVIWTGLSATETATHFSLWDASSGGNAIAYGAFGSSTSLTSGANLDITSCSVTIN